MTGLRTNPPAVIGGATVTTVDDLAQGSDGLPPTDGLRFLLASGARVIIRPSGTEPKIKCYLQSVVPVTGNNVSAAREMAAKELAAIRTDVHTWL
jgi:phosphomannomutase